MFHYKNVVILLLFIIVLSSCVVTKKTNVDTPISSVQLSDDQKFEFQYNFFEANKYYLAGNMDMALSIFKQCLKLDPNSKAVHYKLGSIYMLAKDPGKASFHADKISTDTENTWYLYLAGSIFAQSNQSDKAIEVFNKLINIDSRKMDYYLSLADIYLQKNDLNEAIKVYNNVDMLFGKSEVISIQKNKIFLAQNKPNSAIKEFLALAEFYNNDIYFVRLLADFYIQISKIDEAIYLYNSILDTNLNDGYANIGLAECYRIKGDYEKSFTYLKNAFSSLDLPSELKVSLLYNIINNAKNDASLKQEINLLIDNLYKQYPENNDVKLLYIDLLITSKDYKEARTLLREVVLIKKDNYALWEQLILLENEFQDWDNMYTEVNEALTLFPTQSFLYFFKGFCCIQIEKFDESLEALSFGYKLTTIEDPLRKDFISYLGEVNYKLGNKTKAYTYFDQYLALKPDNLGILNNYAYYLSIDKEQLEKAAKMSKITVDAEITNSTFLDTYAWVLFQIEDYTNALIYMEKAMVNNEDSSAVMFEHYGDILYFNNKIESAIEQWNLALSLDNTNEKLKNKISEKRYID